MGSAMMFLLLAASFGFAFASVPSLPHGKSSGTCPDKWVDASFVDMGCLYFNTTEAMTWEHASTMCQMGSNSTLLEITSEMQMSFIQMELSMIEDHEDGHYSWWTAATDIGINRQWIWITSLTAVEDFMWTSGYPNSRDDYNCMFMYYSHQFLGINALCDDNRYPICQLK